MTADIILLAKTERFSNDSAAIARALFGPRLAVFQGTVGDPLPVQVATATPAFLLSFLSPWIVPEDLLERSGTALNFHPASTDYPGTGCYNFALYEEAEEFGAVCHHMLSQVDTGAIVEERRFPVSPAESVETLKLRTMVTLLAMFHEVCCLIVKDEPMPTPDVAWSRRPFTRREMNELKRIDPSMAADEVARRVRASVYPGYPGPAVTIGNHEFRYPVPERPPIA